MIIALDLLYVALVLGFGLSTFMAGRDLGRRIARKAVRHGR